MRSDDKAFIQILRSLAKLDNPDIIREELAQFRPEDIAEAFPRLTIEEQVGILRQLDAETAAYVLVELPRDTTRGLLDELPDFALAHFLDILPMDEAVELKEDLDPERFERLLELIPKEDAQEIRRLLVFPDDSAGRLMTEDFVEVHPDESISSLLDHIREAPEGEYETVNDIYVLNEDRHLVGVFSLRQAIQAPPGATARDIMNTNIVAAQAVTPAEEVARQIARYGFYAMPLLDERGRMLGIFTVDDAQALLKEEETEDILKLGGVSGSVEAYLSLSPLQLVKRRLPWLMALFVAEFLTGTVMRHYAKSAEGEALNPITFFIPLLIGAGGNSGSQVTTTITRSLAVGEIRTSDVFLVMGREFLVALMIGSALGLVGFGRALLWQSGWSLSVVVGLALPAIVIWAATIGSMLPILAKRLGIDPAVMSAPFITTFVDATGLIIYFEIAKRILGPTLGA
jgi:magnesium transporter